MDKIVVEFSLSQKCFHKQTVADMLQQNLESVMNRSQTDYIVIGVFLNHFDADTFISKTKDVVKDYSMFKNTNGELVVI